MTGPGQAARTCILFDFGGTLDADGVAWKERFAGLYRDEGVDPGADGFAQAFYAADDPLVGALDESVGLPETTRLLVDNLEAGLGRNPARGARIAARFLDETGETVARNRPVLEALRRRYRLGVVSNFYGNLEGVCRGLGLDTLFDVMVDSEVVQARKPDAAIFQAAMGPLGAAPDQTVMVGDSLHRDREGARRSGLGFIWIAPPEAGADAAGESADHPTVNRLGDLAGLLL